MKKFDFSKEVRILQYFLLAFTTYFALRAELLRGSMDLMFALWVISCWMVLFKTYRIEISDDGMIHFKKLVRSVTVKPQEILSITDHLKFDVIHYKGGSLILDPFIENLGQLKSALKSLNPEIQFKDASLIDDKNALRVFLEISLSLLLFLGVMYLGIVHFLVKH